VNLVDRIQETMLIFHFSEVVAVVQDEKVTKLKKKDFVVYTLIQKNLISID